MDDSERARLLDEFKVLTDTSDEFAISFLESSDWSLERALELFMGGQGGYATSSSVDSNTALPPQDDEVTKIMQQHNVDYETALAIKDAGGGADAASGVDAEGVRAPILQKRARLFDTVEQEQGVGYLAHDMSGLSMHPGAFDAHLRIAQAMMQGGNGPGNGAAAAEPPRPSRFAPPRWMMFVGSFEEARNEAKAKKRWLIVNIQDQEQFQSLVLNRDLWSDETTQSFIRDSFVFWQQDKSSFDAQSFITLYNPTPPYPYVCIIDPRTGERSRVLKLKKKEDELRDSFFDQIADFLDTSSFDAPTKRKVPPTSSASMTTSSSSAALGADDHDKDLAAAIQASLQVTEPTKDKEIVPPASKASEKILTQNAATVKLPALEPEPSGSPDATLIQFSFPDGSKSKRRFLKVSPVGMLFSFVHQSNKLAPGAKFELLTSGVPAVSLMQFAEKNLVEADVCNQNLRVRVVEG